MIGTVVIVAWSWSASTAFACGGTTGDDDCPVPPPRTAGAVDPAKCARQAELVGADNCAWTTGMMAQRVLTEGVPWSYVGRLVPSDNALPSKVASPYTVGPDAKIHVVANEVLEVLERRGATGGRLELSGKLLEVEGIEYLVLTEG
ncbi:MAG: hypothetical protein ABMA64_12140 [Myxococcota bacterium]